MILKAYRRLVRHVHRKAIERRVRDWGEQIERLDQQRRNNPGNMELAVTEMQQAKRELAAMDLPPPRVSSAPKSAVRDGVKRFTLLEDRPAR